jgi:arylsulfatase A-like enzyme
MPATEITFAELMQKTGYATCCIGKWDVSNRKPILNRMPNSKGFDYYWGPLGANDAGHVVLHENNTLLGKDEDLASLSRRYTDKSITWMRQQVKAGDEPFLLYLCHTMMHTVIDASPEFRNRTGNGLYADTLEELDHECGRLLQAIDDLGIADDTLVIFTTDNGAWSNDAPRQNPKNAAVVPWSEGKQTAVGSNAPLREGKGSDYEGGVRVPCLVRWPGKVPAGHTSDAIFATLDFLPTFARLTGFEVPQDRVIDGVEQVDLLLGQSEKGNRDHYFYHSGDHGVRQREWKLLHANRWSEKEMERRTYPEDFGTNEVELYNLDEDISETTNLAAQHPDVVAKLQALSLPAEKPAFSPAATRRKAVQGEPKASGKPKRKSESPITIDSSTQLRAENVLPAPAHRFVHFGVDSPGYVFDTIPFWHDGVFHLFFLNPVFDGQGKKTGIKWSHAKTEDFVHWEAMPDALLPGNLDPNCWTGSLMEKEGTFYLFYTGKSLPDRPDLKGDQKIMLATSTDLVHFEKQPDFNFYADGEIYWNKTINGPLDPNLQIHNQRDESFRDPEVFWNPEYDEYWMLLHAREAESQKHCFGVYRSDDLLTWKPRQPLEIAVPVHQSNIDCPDLFQLGGQWVLTFSGGPRYAIADRSEGPYGNHRPADHNLYVPKTARDDQGRILVAGTVRPDIGVAGGRGSMLREYYLSDDGRLLQRPLAEVLAAFSESVGTLDDLAKNVVTGQAERTDEGLQLTRGKQVPRVSLPEPADFLADFTVTLDADSVFRLNFRRGGGQETMQTFEISTLDNHIRLGTIANHSDNTRPVNDRVHQVPAGEPVRVRLFAVGTILTAFVEDHHTLTMNAVSLDNTQLIAEAFQGTVTIRDFTLHAPKFVQTSKQVSVSDVLFIAVDDLNTWSKLYDPSFPIEMPNLERLASRGALFTRAYCAAPACAPSRAAVLSGQRPSTSGLYNNPDKLEKHHRDTVFLPQWFQAHGYRTWGVGKILHGEPLHAGDPTRPIFEQFTKKQVIFPPEKLHGPTTGPGKNLIFDWGEMEGRLGDDRTIDLAIDRIKNARETNAPPVFQAVGIFSPHLPHFARPEHFARYPSENLMLPPMPEDDFDDIPAAGRAMADFQKSWNQHLFDARDAGDTAPLAKLVQSYQAAATYGDEMLGRLLDALDSTGRADETVIVLWSDHGYHLGDKDSVVKFTLWEMACRVPLVIVAPGVTEPGTRIDTPVDLVDLYPTLVELAGLPKKPGLDGESLLPLLKNPKATRDTPAITTFLQGNHAVVTKDWRYIHYADGSEELYRSEDVWNHENLADDPEFAPDIATLRKHVPADETQSAQTIKSPR